MANEFKLVSLLNNQVVLTAGPAISAGTQSQNTGTIVFSNSNGVSFGLNNGTITASAVGGVGGGVAISAGTNSTSTGTVVFANSNGVSFGMNTNGVVTGTVQTNYLTTAMASDAGTNFVATSNSSLFQHTSATSAITSNAMNTSERGNYFYTSNNTFANSTHSHGNIAFSGTNVSASFTSASNGLSIQLSGGAGAAGNTGYLSAGTTNASLGTVNFGNANGVSFGIDGQTITASVQPAGGAQTGISSLGNSQTTYTSGQVQFLGSNALTVRSTTGQGFVFDAPVQTAFVLSNSNNVSFGTNGSTVTATATFAQSVQTQGMVSVNGSTGNISLATGSSLSSSVNGSSITFGLASNITTALQSAGAYLTTAAVSNHSHGFSASGGSSAFQTLNFANSNGITFSNSNGSVIASHNGLTTARASNDAVGLNTAGTSVTWTVNSAGISLNAGAYLTTAANSTHSHGNPTLALTNLTGTTASASNGLTISLSAAAPGAGGGVVVGNTATTFTSGTVIFRGTNLTVNTSAGQFIDLSVAAPGAAAENNWVSLLGANVSGNSTASGSTIGYSGINLTLSGTNGSVVNISAPATSSIVGVNGVSISTNGSTISFSGVPTYTALTTQNRQLGASATINSLGGQSSLWLAPVRIVVPISASTIMAAMISYSGTITSAATAQAGQTLRVGIWSQHTDPSSTSRFDTWWTGAASLTFWNSGTSSVSYNYSLSGGNTTGSSAGSNLMTASVMGVRQINLPIGSTMTPGLYVMGILNISSSAGYSAAMSRMALYMDNPVSIGMGTFGQATNASIGYQDGGVYTAQTASLPASIALNQIQCVNNVMPYFKIGAI